MKRWYVLIFISVYILSVAAQTRPGWQTGKVVSFDWREWTAPSSSGDGQQARLTCRLTLSAGEITYVLQRDSPKEKPPRIDVGSTVNFIFDRDDVLVRDGSGREFRMRVTQRGDHAEVAAATAKAPEAPVETAKAGDGQTVLEVTSNVDGAEIYLGGKLVGHTPATLSVDKGSYLLRVQQRTYMAWQQGIMVAGDKLSFYAELTPQDVMLSEPRGSVAAAARASKKQE